MKQERWYLLSNFKKILFILLLCGLTENTISQSGWTWVNPHPNMYLAKDFVKVSKNIYIVVGDQGSIFRTSDNGLSWSSNYDPNIISSELLYVQFLDVNTGFIVGKDGVILKTINSGNNWEVQSSPSIADFYGLYFTNYSTGYITGYNVILKTTDSGIQWNIVSDSNQLFHLTVENPYFVNSNTGWVIGTYYGQYPYSNLYKTTNAGNNWFSQLSDTKFNKVQFINEQIGYCIGFNNNYIPKGRLNRTIDGGTTWTRISNIDSSRAFTDMMFINNNTGWLIGGNINNMIYKTTDGCLTWSIDLFNISYNKLKMYPDVFFGMSLYNLFTSTNEGKSWNDIFKGFTNTVYNITFINENTGWLSTQPMGVMKTIDGGNSFQYLDTSNPVSLNKQVYHDNQRGFAIPFQYDTIYKTLDGGISWSKQKIGNNITLDDIQVLGANTVVVAAEKIYDYNYFLRSDDDGNTWSSIRMDSSAGYSKIKFFDENNGYYKSARKVFKTSDGGQSWNEILSRTDINFRFDNIDFKDLSTGWVSHMSGTIYMTTNGGLNWIESDISKYYMWGVMDIKVMNKDTGFVFDTYSYIVTTNGGLSWSKKIMPVGEVFSYFFLDSKNFWAGGSNGTLLKTTDGLGYYSEGSGTEIPYRFYLFQNYPNPFNPATTIKYEVPVNALTKLIVYDILGREVITLMNNINSAGIHSIDWNVNYLASGIYFIRLEQGNYSMSRKMILVK